MGNNTKNALQKKAVEGVGTFNRLIGLLLSHIGIGVIPALYPFHGG